jgi:hypothetical protein
MFEKKRSSKQRHMKLTQAGGMLDGIWNPPKFRSGLQNLGDFELRRTPITAVRLCYRDEVFASFPSGAVRCALARFLLNGHAREARVVQ